MDRFQQVQVASLLHGVSRSWRWSGGPSLAGDTSADAIHGGHFLVPDWRPVASAVLDHRPRDFVTKVVAIADWLASGEQDAADANSGARHPQLRSIFSRLAPDGAASNGRDTYFPLRPLAFDENTVFPGPALLPDDARESAAAALWRHFTDDVRRIPAGDFEAAFETYYYLFQRYGWAVPSAHVGATSDVSLFDHGRTTCAIAAALYRSGIDEAELDAMLARRPHALSAERLMLLGGDVTGIQAFLYSITARGAARGLRGRSFFLQLVGEVIARWLLRRLGLPIASLLYSGGGRFYALTQRLDDAQIAELRQDLDRALLRCHRGELYVALGGARLSADSFQTGTRVGEVWAAVGRTLNEQKRQKFGGLPPDELYREVLAPRGAGGADPPCGVCRREGRYLPSYGDALARKCSLCGSFEGLGADLRDAAYLYLGRVEPALPTGPARHYRDTLRAFGAELRLFADERAPECRAAELGRGTLFALRTTDPLTEPSLRAARAAGPGLALGFYLLANVTPRRGAAVAEFADLVAASRGVKRLGIVRMDVDDLGAIFGRGLGSGATLARVAGLSSLLRVFFEGWLAVLAARHNQHGGAGGDPDHVYVIYSGGDDLFLVGAWDRAIGLAREIARDFRRFVGENPALHISGGIVLAEEHFPLYLSADQAGEALERAKGRSEGGRVVKDALDLLGETHSWADVALAERRVRELCALVERHGASRGLVHLLAAIHRQYLEARGRAARAARQPAGDQVPYGRWMWTAAYALTRQAEQAPGSARAGILALRDDLVRPEVVRTLGLSARWAELLLRRDTR